MNFCQITMFCPSLKGNACAGDCVKTLGLITKVKFKKNKEEMAAFVFSDFLIRFLCLCCVFLGNCGKPQGDEILTRPEEN